MNSLIKILMALTGLLFSFLLANAQEINWQGSTLDKPHAISLNFGADYSSYYGVSYLYRLPTQRLPIGLYAEAQVPFGSDLFDDWSGEVGASSALWQQNQLAWTMQVGLIARRYESELATLLNLGANVTTLFGYQGTHLGLSGLAGYERSISTRIEHTGLAVYYPDIQDGWYKSPGGNLKFGVQARGSFGANHLYLTAGKAFGQNFTDNPTLPFYARVSLQRTF